MQQHDIYLGLATLTADGNGGWALPGGGHTSDPAEALEAVASLEGAMRSPPPRQLLEASAPVVVTRRVADNARYVHSRS